MSRPDLAPPSALESHPGEHLAMLTGALAGRLADLLDRVLPGGQEHGAARAFLRAMARDAEDPLARLRSGTETHPVGRLTRAFDLSPVEVDLLLLAGLPDEHEGYAGVLRTLHPRGEPRPSVGFAAQLLCASPAERRLLRSVLVSGAAVRAGILRLSDDGPFFERSLLLADSLWSALHGLDAWPASIECSREAPPCAGLSGWLASPAANRARAALAGDEPRTILVTAELEEIAQERGAALVAAAGGEPARILLPARPTPELERLVSLHAVARGVVPVVRLAAAEGPGAPEAPVFAGHPGPVVVAGRASGMVVRGDRPVLEVLAVRLTPGARQELWRAAAPELAGEAAALAARYTVEPGVAMAAANDARAVARGERRALRLEDVAQGVRTRAGLTLSSGVKLVRPTATWEQLVLPERRMAQLREAIDRLLHQGQVLDGWGFLAGRPGARGVRMLFAGGSGTGKTFSAEVMAHALGLDLLVVDISRVVSKWIGETEKNLAEVFDVAERAQAVLLFDEADALFGKRTEVSDAHDRYANLETAYLLTRLERFEGLAILSTNLRQNLDPAFLRRLEFVLDFEEPGPAERLRLWEGHLPPGAPRSEDVNLRELASHYPVVGGFIRNAAVAAGFLAAADGTAITRSHIVRAVRREYEKTGRAFPGLPAGMHAL
jgi:ATP-dependent 26S proteasome regulatory subunit